MEFEIDNDFDNVVQIKVIGVGGGGGNAVNRMVSSEIQGVEFIAVNTDRQVLYHSKATHKVQIGEKVSRGQGAGGKPEVGQRAAEESRDELAQILNGTDMVFITAGMGGGTGTGAAPVIAQVAKELGILTVGIVTKPFNFEGRRRMQQAEKGIAEISQHVDSLVVIPNERLKYASATKITLANAFEVADDVLRHGVASISDLIKVPGLVNLDFADVTSVMKDAGLAHMGIGRAQGKDKAEQAATMAISSPLLETTINGARGVIINITSSTDIGLEEVEAASSLITAAAHPDANIIWGAAFDDSLDDEMVITVIATGFGLEDQPLPEAAPAKKQQEMQSKTAAKPAASSSAPASRFGSIPTQQPQQAEPAYEEPEDTSAEDDYFDIMNIFKRKGE